MARRELLRRGALGFGALTVGRLLTACGSGASPGPSPADLKELDRAIRGRIVLPQSRGYRAARLVWKSRYDNARSAAVIQVADSGDVRTAVEFARAHNRRLITRSGGHSFAGYSTGDGLVLDLSGLADVRFEPGGEVATLGAGATTLRRFSAAHSIGKVLIEAADGAVNSLAADETAFVHRDNLFVSQYQARWRTGAPRSVVEANLDWTDGLYRAVAPYRSGRAYQNYIDAALDDWEQAYYGANLARLRRVKSKYDPHDFFRFRQSIPPA